MKQKLSLALLLTILVTSIFGAGPTLAADADNFKVIGYYSELLFDDPVDKTLQFDKLTHVIYAFLIPRKDGTLVPIAKPQRLKEIVEKAHQKNVKVCIAVGGWSYENLPLYPTFEAMAATESTRNLFVDNVIKFVDDNRLDGVEMDWEYPKIGQSARNYEDIVLKLKTKLHARKKCLTAAVNGAGSVNQPMTASFAISNNALKEFDWLNVMSYDVGDKQHAPYAHAETSIAYWKNRGISKEKIVLGMPLYARPSWMQYRHLVAASKENAWRDYSPTAPLPSWYNGITTAREKTRLALMQAGGVMLFDINEDTTDETSILGAIDGVRKGVQQHGIQSIANSNALIVMNNELTRDGTIPGPYLDTKGQLMVPLIPVMTALKAEVTVDDAQKSVRVSRSGKTFDIPYDAYFMVSDGQLVKLTARTTQKNGHTYVEAKKLLEPLGFQAVWHSGSRTAVISY